MSARSWRAPLLAAASGILLGAAFLPVALPFLAWFAFVPLMLALDAAAKGPRPSRAAFGAGYAGGFVFFLTGTHWIALLSDVAITVPALKYVGWVLAAAYLGLFWALAAWLAGVLARRSGLPAHVAFVPAMLLVEELRGSGELGFPWFQPGYTQGTLYGVLQLAALGSVTLVTLWVLVLNAFVARAWVKRSPLAWGAVLVCLALPWANPGAWTARGAGAVSASPVPGALRVLLVQGDIPGELKWSGKHQREILATFVAMSDSALRAAGPGTGGTIVIWPETATGSYLRKQIDQAITVTEFAHRTGAPVFSGYADYTFDEQGRVRPYNSAGLFRPDGELGESYAKRHLVPFGERMPFQGLVPQLGKLDVGQAEWVPGTKSVRFESPAGPFACLICFESIFPDLARDDVRHGARWLVNVTNDEWFGNGSALHQHAAIAPFRAVENGVPLVRCANTGVTALFDERGRRIGSAPVFTPAVLAGWIDGRRTAGGWRPTPFVRFGDWPGVLAVLAAVALAVRRWRTA